MGRHRVTLIRGDGVGPEVIDAAVRCIEATGVDIEWEEVEAGERAISKYGTPLPEETLRSIERNRVALKGPITTPVGTGFRSVNVAIRQKLDLFACVRPCKLYPGVRTRYTNVDLVVIRETTEDVYAGIEFQEGSPEVKRLIEFLRGQGAEVREDSGISIKPISRFASERIIRFAFEYARKNGRRKVTVVHKANIMKFSDGLFLEVAKRVAQEYPDISFEDRIVDNMCMQLVQKPELYDVIVTTNLYGDIISDLCAGLVGGLGMAPSCNLGEKAAVFEPTHGSAPKYAGMNKVNPTATILSGVMMLRYLGEKEAADRLEAAVAKTIAEGKYVTYDLKPNPDDPTAVGTREMADAIIRAL
jgi:isocitrate dehydrogenase (NAD+)